jgi:phosphate transport system protein
LSHQNTGPHILHQFDEDLESIRTKVLRMGGLVEQQVENSLIALINADSSLAEQVATSDYKINSIEVAIDEECTKIIALRQPTASDLRLVITIIKTITDLERIGDEAEKIGRYAIDLASEAHDENYFSSLRHLGEQVKIMLHDSLNAFARMDVEAAFRIAASDKQINEEYDVLTRMLINNMVDDPRDKKIVKSSLGVMWCGRALERIGDHAKNICEYVIFTVEGKDVRHTSFKPIEEDTNGSM